MSAFRRLLAAALAAVAIVAAAGAAAAQSPAGAQWIWGSWAAPGERPAGEKVWFRKTIDLPAAPKEATAFGACDNHFVLWVNGARAGRGDSWQEASKIPIGRHLRAGRNVLAIEGTNDNAPAGLLFFCDIVLEGGKTVRVASDPTFLTAPAAPKDWTDPNFPAKDWKPAASFGPYGSGPWQNVVFDVERRYAAPDGFHVEAAAEGIGSLVALARGDARDLFVSVEGGPILRLRDADGDGRYDDTETFCGEVAGCHGLCWSKGSLFATGKGPDGAGLYRITPRGAGAKTNGGAKPNEIVCLGTFSGEGNEHGVHGVVEGPDGRLYLAVGNHHQIDKPWSADSPYRWHYEGSLLPTYGDPGGHAVGIRSPGGTVVSVDREGKDWRVMAGGFRNHYDLAFDASGELFTVDSDMEWDVGLPWYRPVAALHVIPGGEYGWRTGSGCWPRTHADALPSAADLGRGSPTGTVFYLGKRFPARWRGALLCGDWSQGQILAIHLDPKDSTYVGKVETLLSGHPLNVTDLEVDADGALLFTTGGRGTHGGVYRLAYDGPADAGSAAGGAAGDGAPSRREGFDWLFAKSDPLAALQSNDRFARFAAARALERKGKVGIRAALALDDDRAVADGLVAMARALFAAPDRADWNEAFSRALGILKAKGTGEARLSALRALELLAIAPVEPDPKKIADAKKTLLANFPCGDRAADRGLAILLAHFAPDGAIEKLLAQMEGEGSRAEGIHMAYSLRCIRAGWTSDQKLRLFRWVREAERSSGGASYGGYLIDIVKAMEPLFTKEEWEAARALVGAAPVAAPAVVALAGGEPKDFDRTLGFLDGALHSPRRDPAEGAILFGSLCSKCHLYGSEGGRGGPELTTIGARFSIEDQLDAILHPSRVISSQYQSFVVWKKSGEVVNGVRLADDPKHVLLLLGDGSRADIPRAEISEAEVSPLSTMPEGLLDSLTLEQTADLFAFLNVRGPAPAPPAESKWRVLFDGKTLDGWDGDPELWHVEDGAIVGRANGLPGSRFLVSKGRYKDFAVEFDVKLETGNSGLQFRATETEPHVLVGYQADVGQSYWGSLYEEGGRGMLAQVANEIWTTAVDRKGYNHYLVCAEGDRLRIELNGVTTVDLRDSAASEGLLGFQLHAGIENRVWLRNIRIRE